MYRAAKANESSEVIAIGMDENQVGSYNDTGVWCDFTFSEIPQPDETLLAHIESVQYNGSILKVIDGVVVLKSAEEIS